MSTVLTREQIKVVDDRQIEPCEVPEWGGMLYVRGLSGTDRDTYEGEMIVIKGQGRKRTQELNLRDLRAKLVVRTAVDSDNPDTAKALFQMDDVPWLTKKSAAALQRVYLVAQRLSGLSEEEVEELAAELGKGQNDSSGTDLRLPSGIPESETSNETSAPESSASGWPSTESSPSESDD